MKPKHVRAMLIQTGTVLIMSAVAGYILYQHIGLASVAVAVGLLLVGILSISFEKIDPLFFGIPVLIACLPELIDRYIVVDTKLLSENVVNYSANYTEIEATTPISINLLIGMVILTGYMILSYLHSFKKDYAAMVSAKTDESEIKLTTGKKLKTGLLFVGIGFVSSAAITLTLLLVQPAISAFFESLLSVRLFFGLFSIILLAVFLRFLVAAGYRNRSK